jgi:uncharacterized protein
MESRTKTRLAYVGRGAVNLLMVLAVLFGFQGLLRFARVPGRLGQAALCLALVGLYLLGVRWIERRPPSELLLRSASREFPAGLVLGIALFTTLMLSLWMFRVYSPAGWGSLVSLPGGFVSALIAAIIEEIIFRGFLFRLSEKVLGLWGALALTSALFGAAHAFNRGATMGSDLAIAVEAGLLLGGAYALTQRLWLPIGIHLGWNFAEGSIFGMAVSGGTNRESLIAGSLHGQDWLTGGAFGPENSVGAVIICLAAGIFLLAKTVRRIEPTPEQAP